MPSATCTNTTGETGRNVPVPRNTSGNGPASATATSCRCASILASSPAGTRVGGSSVMCAGIARAVGSPSCSRHACSCAPYGGGTATATPMLRVPIVTDALCGPSVFRRDETDPVVCGGQRFRGDQARLLRAGGQDRVQPLLVGQVRLGLLLERQDEFDHHLGEILLEIAVPVAGVGRLQLGDPAPGQRRVDGQQVRHSRLTLL